MKIRVDRKNRNHVLEMLIPFFGVFEPYRISIIPITAIILAVIIISRGRINFRTHKSTMPYVLFVIYMSLRDVLHMFLSVSDSVGVQFNRLLANVVLYMLLFLACNNDFDEDALFKWWKVAGIIFGAGMLYHVFQILVLNQDVYPLSIIPGYDIAHDTQTLYSRPSSFFSEPAAYVSSMLPLLFLSLKKKNFKWAAISTFLILVSTSTVGVILSAVLWIVFIIFEKKSFKVTFIYLVLVVCFVIMFQYLPIFSDTLQKLQDVSEGESTWGSRIQEPFQMIGAMRWNELPFGTSMLNAREFIYHNIERFSNPSTLIERISDDETMFLNTIALIIFRYGVIGLLFYLRIFKNKLFNKKYEARMYSIMLIVASFGQGFISSPSIPLILIMLYANKNEDLINTKR